jgi:hypothetical protein
MRASDRFSQGGGISQSRYTRREDTFYELRPEAVGTEGFLCRKTRTTHGSSNPLQDGNLRRYLNLLATSSFAGSGFTARASCPTAAQLFASSVHV